MTNPTVYAPREPRREGQGEQWTEEQKAAYQAQWDNYTFLMAKRQPGMSRDFPAVIQSIGEPHEAEKTYQGVTTKRTVRTIGVQLTTKGVDLLRFYEDSADNPFNEKTLLYQSILAAAGIKPDERKGLTIDFAELVGKPVRVTLEKQGPRNDGKRGGFWTKLRAISPVFEDDDLPQTPPTQQVPGTAPTEDTPW